MILFFAGLDDAARRGIPVVFLVLMIPLPALIYNQVTFPLQLLGVANSLSKFFRVLSSCLARRKRSRPAELRPSKSWKHAVASVR